ncbi:COMPASS component Spp1p [[Candida] jaroonii]|uniref:COMPASS component Spp1p n=1 Tax=[Candida] jaroonii TaxID=467808 RepID=A0ACA9YDW8_9ASCO|nr:COMPASS component Spp1p [[Candida] jaroonii]
MATRYSTVKHRVLEEESNEELIKQYKKLQNAPKFDFNSEEVYCICRKPDRGELMIGCDGCDEWYHFKCMKINLLYKDLVAKFYCKFCTWKGKGYTHWKRKCRADNCWNPIEINSKYCSKQCGLNFFKNLVDVDNNETYKAIIDKDFTVDEFQKLGNEFPELPEVKDIENNIGKFPEELRLDLTKLINQLKDINENIELFNRRTELLSQYKIKMKAVNELVTKKMKSKKKIELCLYDKNLRELSSSVIEEFDIEKVSDYVVNEDDEKDEDQYGNICIHEKRKCPRHNGWINLVNDGFLSSIYKYQSTLAKLQQEEKLLLRDYSIQVYEQ